MAAAPASCLGRVKRTPTKDATRSRVTQTGRPQVSAYIRQINSTQLFEMSYEHALPSDALRRFAHAAYALSDEAATSA
jgi:hypothetical protein